MTPAEKAFYALVKKGRAMGADKVTPTEYVVRFNKEDPFDFGVQCRESGFNLEQALYALSRSDLDNKDADRFTQGFNSVV